MGRFTELEIINLMQYVAYGGDIELWKRHNNATDLEFEELREHILEVHEIDILTHKVDNTPILTQLKSLVDTGKRAVKDLRCGRNLILPKTKQNTRMEICKQCPYYNPKRNKCGKCKCHLSYKSKLASGKCPIGKW